MKSKQFQKLVDIPNFIANYWYELDDVTGFDFYKIEIEKQLKEREDVKRMLLEIWENKTELSLKDVFSELNKLMLRYIKINLVIGGGLKVYHPGYKSGTGKKIVKYKQLKKYWFDEMGYKYHFVVSMGPTNSFFYVAEILGGRIKLNSRKKESEFLLMNYSLWVKYMREYSIRYVKPSRNTYEKQPYNWDTHGDDYQVGGDYPGPGILVGGIQ